MHVECLPLDPALLLHREPDCLGGKGRRGFYPPLTLLLSQLVLTSDPIFWFDAIKTGGKGWRFYTVYKECVCMICWGLEQPHNISNKHRRLNWTRHYVDITITDGRTALLGTGVHPQIHLVWTVDKALWSFVPHLLIYYHQPKQDFKDQAHVEWCLTTVIIMCIACIVSKTFHKMIVIQFIFKCIGRSRSVPSCTIRWRQRSHFHHVIAPSPRSAAKQSSLKKNKNSDHNERRDHFLLLFSYYSCFCKTYCIQGRGPSKAEKNKIRE